MTTKSNSIFQYKNNLKSLALVALVGITPFIREAVPVGTLQSTALLTSCYVITMLAGLFLIDQNSNFSLSLISFIALSYAVVPYWTLKISPFNYYLGSYLAVYNSSLLSNYLCDKYKLSFIYRAILQLLIDTLSCIAIFTLYGVKLKYLVHNPLEIAACLACALTVNYLRGSSSSKR